MRKNSIKFVVSFIFFIFVFFTKNPCTFAEGFDWRIEVQTPFEYNTNVEQRLPVDTTDLTGDFSFRPTLKGIFRYTFPSNTQIFFQGEGMLNLFTQMQNHSQGILVGTGMISQWFFNSLNVYLGYQPIFLVPLFPGDTRTKSRFDNDLIAGAVYYYILPEDNLIFSAFHFDAMLTEVTMVAYNGYTLMAGYRHNFFKELSSQFDVRGQFRNYYTQTEGKKLKSDEFRLALSLTLDYELFSWLILEGKGELIFVTDIETKISERSLPFGIFGVNIIIGGF